MNWPQIILFGAAECGVIESIVGKKPVFQRSNSLYRRPFTSLTTRHRIPVYAAKVTIHDIASHQNLKSRTLSSLWPHLGKSLGGGDVPSPKLPEARRGLDWRHLRFAEVKAFRFERSSLPLIAPKRTPGSCRLSFLGLGDFLIFLGRSVDRPHAKRERVWRERAWERGRADSYRRAQAQDNSQSCYFMSGSAES